MTRQRGLGVGERTGGPQTDELDNWVVATPTRVALSDGVETLTFQELDEATKTLRCSLDQAYRAANRPRFLPVVVDYSIESAVTILTCLRFQIPFAPLDSFLPPERLRTVLARLDHPAVAFVPSTALQIWNQNVIPAFKPVGLESADSATGERAKGEGVAIFTSGSTGVPKGVVLTWSALEERWRIRESISAGGSDPRATNVVVPLTWILGLSRLARVFFGYSVLRIDPRAVSTKDLFGLLHDFEVTHLTLPTQLARLVAQSKFPETVSLSHVRELTFGGEGFRYEFLHRLAPMFAQDVVVSHSLGSSEAPLAFIHRFFFADMPVSGTVHIGKIFHVHDVRLDLLAVGPKDVYEVWCSGSLASEYLGQPDLTSQRFVRDPTGKRWWRSGDLVRRDKNGLYLHAGRIDDLVKVSGKLSSPSEAERLLFSLEGVRAAAVLPEVKNFSTRLVAHLELEKTSRLTQAEIVGFLAKFLEPHLIPTRFEFHQALPSTPRGKVDRAALGDSG